MFDMDRPSQSEKKNMRGSKKPPIDSLDVAFIEFDLWVCLKMLCSPLYPMVFMIIIPFLNGPKPNGFHDHYPVFKWP